MQTQLKQVSLVAVSGYEGARVRVLRAPSTSPTSATSATCRAYLRFTLYGSRGRQRWLVSERHQ